MGKGVLERFRAEGGREVSMGLLLVLETCQRTPIFLEWLSGVLLQFSTLSLFPTC